MTDEMIYICNDMIFVVFGEAKPEIIWKYFVYIMLISR